MEIASHQQSPFYHLVRIFEVVNKSLQGTFGEKGIIVSYELRAPDISLCRIQNMLSSI